MELMSYQKKVLNNLSSYLQSLNDEKDIFKAWTKYWQNQDVAVGFGGVPNYNDEISKVPHVCMKVPTGGGKTFMACASLKKIFDKMPKNKKKVVIWLVPSNPILIQTIKNLSDTYHPYRQRLDYDFAGRVGIYTKDMLLNGQNFSPETVDEMLTVCILSYDSLRIDGRKKEGRKVYQENGNLINFARSIEDKDILLEDTPDTALIQTLRQLTPVIIVDESHNATSDLSIEMLKNLNASFILDLTATPRNNSNIISYVDARELKKENMVKLPVIVYNRNTKQDVIIDAIQLQRTLEQKAKLSREQGGNYIRPIVLFQAQPKTSDDSETFEKLKQKLIEIGIKEEEIGIKTSNIDTISRENLLSETCQIRYIITVNALKEGWDCSFAYILASIANKSSQVDVEQILGRVLRQPYAKRNKDSVLNTSYVLTSSADFHATLESIIKGLNDAGFSKKDYRIATEIENNIVNNKNDNNTKQQNIFEQTEDNIEVDDFSDINTEETKNILEKASDEQTTNIEKMIEQAEKETNEYQIMVEESENNIFIAGELGSMLNQIEIQSQFKDEISELKIPQFYLKNTPNLFENESTIILEPEHLSEGFILANQDANIDFELSTGEIYKVDIEEHGEAIPKYMIAKKNESEYVRKLLATLPQEQKLEKCASMIVNIINQNNRYATADVDKYVKRIIENMTNDELSAIETSIEAYAYKIKEKIRTLENEYRKAKFQSWLDSAKIICKGSYEFPQIITPSETTNSIPKSLYTEEKDDLNGLENKIIDNIVALDNISWWHRIIDRKGLRINGFINHYPDFIIKTKRGNIILVEAKGNDRANSDSIDKLQLGRKWQAKAGEDKYRYFMVFENDNLNMDGSKTIEELVEILKEL